MGCAHTSQIKIAPFYIWKSPRRRFFSARAKRLQRQKAPETPPIQIFGYHIRWLSQCAANNMLLQNEIQRSKGSGSERKKKRRRRKMIVRRHGILPRRSNGRDKFNRKVCGWSCQWRTSSASSTFRHRLIRDAAGKKWNYVAGLCTWPHSVATGDNWASCTRQKRFSPECQRRFEMAW